MKIHWVLVQMQLLKNVNDDFGSVFQRFLLTVSG